MKATKVLMAMAIMLFAGLLFKACQHDEFDDGSLISQQDGYISEEDALRESTLLVINNQPACINPDDPVYVKNTQQETAQWGNPRDPFVKIVDIAYYNTLTHFVLEVKSTHGWADLEIDGESVWVDGTVDENQWGEYSTELPDEWAAGDVYGFALKVAGFGPPADFEVEYHLVGECGRPRDTETLVVDVYSPVTGKTWMDRNLGASRAATSSTDSEAYGDLYQWGRAADGHQKRNSPTVSTLSSIDQPGHGNFILAPNSPYDWRSPQNTDLWQGVNGVNNPCPPGYRLPTDAELNAERLSWSSNNSAGAFASPLKLPVAGLRFFSSGSLYGVGSYGRYWSSTVDGIHSRRLGFASTGANIDNYSRAYGYSVRCLKDY